jgi:RNA polymerase primary sigma factor
VVHLAKRYVGRGVDLADLISEGNLGLLRAAEGFDATMGTRFSTYASLWIKQSLERAVIKQGKMVRVPAYLKRLIIQWRQTQARLQEELGRTPTQEETAARLGLPAKKLRFLQRGLLTHGAAFQGSTDEQGLNCLALLADGDDAGGPESAVARRDEVRYVLDLLQRMDERLAGILRLRFGLGGEEPMTHQMVGERIGVTRERVRQLEREALHVLREGLEAA